jgi:hypothetical protein
MADINLLQSSNLPSSGSQQLFKSLGVLGWIFLTLSAILFIGLFALNMSVTAKTKEVIASRIEVENKIKKQENYSPLVTRQEKAKNLRLLLDGHLLWSEVVPNFSRHTLNTATFTKFAANSDGTTNITGRVPSFEELSKMMKAFQADNNDYIKDVKLVNVALGSDGDNQITYTIKVTFNSEKLKMENPNNTAQLESNQQ